MSYLVTAIATGQFPTGGGLMKNPKCDVCGTNKGVQVDVVDPFRHEIDNEIVFMDLCPDCLQNRKDDI